MKKVFGIIIAVLFIAITTAAFAAGPGGYGGGMGGFGGVNLSKEQQGQMWQLREKFNNDTSALRYELFQKRAELRTLFADPKATDAAILAKEKEVNALRQKMHDRMVRFKLDQRKILTPEQLKQFGNRGQGRGFGGQHGRMGGPGMGGPGAGGCGGF